MGGETQEGAEGGTGWRGRAACGRKAAIVFGCSVCGWSVRQLQCEGM